LLGALWSLVWSGEVTNDTLAPVRSRLRAHSEHSQRRHRSPRHGTRRARLPGSEGRWWLLERLMPRSNVSDTERVTRMVDVLLERYGVLPREALGIETLAQFSEVYPVMKALEEAGRIRRGFFVKGLAPTQFALPGADDRLRLLREPNPNVSAVTLSATDPANPYGALLPWPENESRPQRAIGARVIILDGTLIGYVNRSAQGLITFCSGTAVDQQRRLETLISALRDGVDSRGHGALTIREINGHSSTESPLARDFLRLGFVSTREGLLCRPREPTPKLKTIAADGLKGTPDG